VHSAQGVTADTAQAVIGESASRAVAYVALSRGRERNDVYIYSRAAGEGEHEHHQLLDAVEVHQMRRGNKDAAAHCLRIILTNDDRPCTMHAHTERADRRWLPRSWQTCWNATTNAAHIAGKPGAATAKPNAPARLTTNASSVTTAPVFSVTMATGWSFRP
jgi:hypothetical protein